MVKTALDLKEKSDNEIVSLVQDGNMAAFEILIDRHQDKAIQLAYSFTRHFEDARDLAQDAFVKAYQAIHKFEGKSQFSTWLFRIIANTCKDFFKKKKEVIMQDSTIFEMLEEHGKENDNSASDLKELLTEAVEQLSENQKLVITLRYFQGHTVDEVAAILEVAPGTVKATSHQAIQVLKKRIFEGGENDSI